MTKPMSLRIDFKLLDYSNYSVMNEDGEDLVSDSNARSIWLDKAREYVKTGGKISIYFLYKEIFSPQEFNEFFK